MKPRTTAIGNRFGSIAMRPSLRFLHDHEKSDEEEGGDEADGQVGSITLTSREPT